MVVRQRHPPRTVGAGQRHDRGGTHDAAADAAAAIGIDATSARLRHIDATSQFGKPSVGGRLWCLSQLIEDSVYPIWPRRSIFA